MKEQHKSVGKMWEDYSSSIDERHGDTNKAYSVWNFCNDEKSANALAQLVKAGTKTATSSLHYFYTIEDEPLPEKNDFSIILDWNGISQCIIRTTSVSIVAFKDVTEDFARTEGEGDQTLGYWRKVHRDFFSEELKVLEMDFSEDMLVVCEEFEMVYSK
jgi:uncharacterized protein YhfF